MQQPFTQAGFYLGCLRGRSSPQQKVPSFPPPPKKRDCYHYSVLVTISEESSGRDEVSSLTVTFLKIVSQNVPSCILAHIHFKEFPGGAYPDPPKKVLASAARDFSPKR